MTRVDTYLKVLNQKAKNEGRFFKAESSLSSISVTTQEGRKVIIYNERMTNAIRKTLTETLEGQPRSYSI